MAAMKMLAPKVPGPEALEEAGGRGTQRDQLPQRFQPKHTLTL